MALKPQGLSPSLNSLVSPQIGESLIFTWNFIPRNNNDNLWFSTVTIFPRGSATAVFTRQIEHMTFLDLSEEEHNLIIGTSYDWQVRVTANNGDVAVSDRQQFRFENIETLGSLQWPDGPIPYEYIGTRKYFEDIRINARAILSDHRLITNQEQELFNRLGGLFTGQIVPAKADFQLIEDTLYLLARLEETYAEEVTDLIEDGLGAGDIHRIYLFFDKIASNPPSEPRNVTVNIVGNTSYGIASGSARNDGVEDLTVDVQWTPQAVPTNSFQINFANEINSDIHYYRLELNTGFTDRQFRQVLFFRVADVNAMPNRRIEYVMEHIEWQHLSSTRITRYSVSTTAIDLRGNESSNFMSTVDRNNVPLGIASYQLQVQHRNIADNANIRDFFDIFNGTGLSFVHTVANTAVGFYRYRVRLRDVNGFQSAWFSMSGAVVIDPLRPPGVPVLRVSARTVNSLTFAWNAVPTAESYDVEGFSNQTGLSRQITGLQPNTNRTIRVRARNRAGVSNWANITGTTLQPPLVTTTENAIQTRIHRTGQRIIHSTGRISTNNPIWRTDLHNHQIMFGEWIELRDGRVSGMNVRRGTRWGNHTTFIFIDHAAWRQRLQGRTITRVEMRIRRLNTQHGYPNDGRFLFVGTHNYNAVGNLPAANGNLVVSNLTKINANWSRNERRWIELPRAWGDRLRDGNIRGFAVRNTTPSNMPPATGHSYLRFFGSNANADNRLQIRITYR